MGCVRNSKELGPWQLHAAASILQRTVQSDYRLFGSEVYKKEMHGPFFPNPFPETANFPVYILRTTKRDDMATPAKPHHWIANHFVSLA